MKNFKNTLRSVGNNPQFSFSKRTFEEKEQLMHLATDWLASLNIDYYKTRVGEYSRDIQRLNEAQQTNSVQKLLDKGKFPKHVNSLFELSEIIFIYEGLHPIADTRLTQRIRDFVKGTEQVTSESTKSMSTKGRDISFELFMASLFARAGYELDFGSEADLMAISTQHTFFVECKRPQSINSVRSNVRGAAKQIVKRLTGSKASSSSYGVIALSISKIINPDLELLVALNEQSINQRLINESENFIELNQHHWSNLKENKLIGIMTLLQTPAVVENHNMITTCNFLMGNNIIASGRFGLELLKKLADQLKPAMSGD